MLFPLACRCLARLTCVGALPAARCQAAALSPAGVDPWELSEGASPSCTFLLNSQSIEALAFRVDVRSRRDGALLARCYVEPATLQVRAARPRRGCPAAAALAHRGPGLLAAPAGQGGVVSARLSLLHSFLTCPYPAHTHTPWPPPPRAGPGGQHLGRPGHARPTPRGHLPRLLPGGVGAAPPRQQPGQPAAHALGAGRQHPGHWVRAGVPAGGRAAPCGLCSIKGQPGPGAGLSAPLTCSDAHPEPRVRVTPAAHAHTHTDITLPTLSNPPHLAPPSSVNPAFLPSTPPSPTPTHPAGTAAQAPQRCMATTCRRTRCCPSRRRP